MARGSLHSICRWTFNPGKYDIDHGARINGMNIAIAGLVQKAFDKMYV